MDNNSWNIGTHVFGVGFCFLGYITIGIMSMERLIVFHSPNFYLRNCVAARVQRYVWVTWLGTIFIYYFTRYGACYLMFPDATMGDVLGRCNKVSFSLFGFTIASVIIVSLICYAKIFLIIWSEGKNTDSDKRVTLTSAARSMKQYKSTTLVFFYLIAVILTGIGYVLVMAQGLDSRPQRLFIDTVNMFNCVVDPCMYVLWFRECRMEMLKIVALLFPRLSINVEKMRNDVFDVVTYSNCTDNQTIDIYGERRKNTIIAWIWFTT